MTRDFSDDDTCTGPCRQTKDSSACTVDIELLKLEQNATSVTLETRIICNENERHFRLTTDRIPQIWPWVAVIKIQVHNYGSVPVLDAP